MMIKNEAMSLSPAFAAGILLGGVFFGGLWWTVQKLVSSKRTSLWVSVSLFVRTSLVLTGFYFIGRAHWDKLVACVVGFIVARFIVLRLTRMHGKVTPLFKEDAHAS